MATVKVINPKPVKVPPPTYQLTLSEKEARVLYTVVRRIGGSTVNSDRMYTDSIMCAFRNLRLVPSLDDDVDIGNISFENTY